MLVAVTYLEQLEPTRRKPRVAGTGSAQLVRLVRPSVRFVRFLYRTVGHDWQWTSRLAWSDESWRDALAQPEREVWVSWHLGRPTGFVELVAGTQNGHTTTNIKYLGLLPGNCGSGLGRHLLTEASRRAWTLHQRAPILPPVERVVVDTCELDSPHALPNYLARGFQIVWEGPEDREVSPPLLVAARRDWASGGP